MYPAQMNKLDVVSALIDRAEQATASVNADVPVKTSGSGDLSSPVVVFSDVDATRVDQGTPNVVGVVQDAGVVIAHKFRHTYNATVIVEARSTNEVDAYNLVRACRDYFTVYEDSPTALDSDTISVSVSEVAQGDFQVDLPTPTMKQMVTVEVRYTDIVVSPVDTLGLAEVKPIESIYDDFDSY
jgi:hypothetical protein